MIDLTQNKRLCRNSYGAIVCYQCSSPYLNIEYRETVVKIAQLTDSQGKSRQPFYQTVTRQEPTNLICDACGAWQELSL